VHIAEPNASLTQVIHQACLLFIFGCDPDLVRVIVVILLVALSSPSHTYQVVCGFSHLHGMPVGIIANNGILFSESSLKAAHFIEVGLLFVVCCWLAENKPHTSQPPQRNREHHQQGLGDHLFRMSLFVCLPPTVVLPAQDSPRLPPEHHRIHGGAQGGERRHRQKRSQARDRRRHGKGNKTTGAVLCFIFLKQLLCF
jgi:hypothetical protein